MGVCKPGRGPHQTPDLLRLTMGGCLSPSAVRETGYRLSRPICDNSIRSLRLVRQMTLSLQSRALAPIIVLFLIKYILLVNVIWLKMHNVVIDTRVPVRERTVFN